MKTSILEITVALLFSVLFYILYLKFAILRVYKKYDFEITNVSAAIYTTTLSIAFILIYTAMPQSVLYAYGIIKMNSISTLPLWKSFAPLLGQYLLLLVVVYFLLVFISRYIFKLFIGKEGIYNRIVNEERIKVIFFSMITISISIITRYFVEQIAQQMIPISNSIF
ncbi:hypothetical protein Aeqsu_0192 [Aequorivita sublithincola DSM 14238]|uniref:Uncharacterized protein n=1 Tax=Aequorivita sublithincola (strain DSM 14238 / LMG 21431 / ACAM 643 / 9-3) TaxID=746697 RepID=I3YRU9_AEQSU|nr:hypothetical protein [Aequorivita sublithincola]AFL79717.1 hypothetical protein Aeqsu_0192 [Aequorivita sublithincola DSM 14238]